MWIRVVVDQIRKPIALGAIPFIIQEANKYLQNMKPPTWDEILTNAQNLRMHESIKIYTAFVADNVTQKSERTRITRKNRARSEGQCYRRIKLKTSGGNGGRE